MQARPSVWCGLAGPTGSATARNSFSRGAPILPDAKSVLPRTHFWVLRRQNRHPQPETLFLAVLRCASAHAAAFRRQSRVRIRFNGPAFLAAPRGTRRHQAGGPGAPKRDQDHGFQNLLPSPPPPKLLTPPARPSRSRGKAPLSQRRCRGESRRCFRSLGARFRRHSDGS